MHVSIPVVSRIIAKDLAIHRIPGRPVIFRWWSTYQPPSLHFEFLITESLLGLIPEFEINDAASLRLRLPDNIAEATVDRLYTKQVDRVKRLDGTRHNLVSLLRGEIPVFAEKCKAWQLGHNCKCDVATWKRALLVLQLFVEADQLGCTS